jgi:hypothetical protein
MNDNAEAFAYVREMAIDNETSLGQLQYAAGARREGLT